MLYSITLNLALGVFALGTLFRVIRWFTIKIGPEADRFSTRERIYQAARGIAVVFFSRKILVVTRTFFSRVVFQTHLYKKDAVRWVMHFTMYAGILLLVVFHAFDDQITDALFQGFYSTLNPFFFLRNFFGALVIVGICIAGFRRLSARGIKRFTSTHDILALVLLSIILFSGFFLEAAQIISEPLFDEMVEDYADYEDSHELEGLKGHWAKYFGVVFAVPPEGTSPDLLEAGRQIHVSSCMDCHDRPGSAFISNTVGKIIKPAGVLLNSVRLDIILLQVHFLCCFAMLAYLPFSKFMHLFTSSVSLMIQSLEDQNDLSVANRVSRRVISLDACVNCGQCSLHCSVEPIHRVLKNPDILPSHKLGSLKKRVRKQSVQGSNQSGFYEGQVICTECYRCTQVCPAGINLQDLWMASKSELAIPVPLASSPGNEDEKPRKKTDLHPGAEPVASPPRDAWAPQDYSADPAFFSGCIQCGMCTNVCPVTANYQQDPQCLGHMALTPQRIVNTYRLGITDHALDSSMVRDCFMCFKCQEFCPGEIPVAELIYALRNRGYSKRKTM